MGMEILAVKKCWDDIFPGFKEHRFTPAELKFGFIREGSIIHPILHKRFFSELKRVNEKYRAELKGFFELETETTQLPEEPDELSEYCKVIVKRGWEDLSRIQYAMALALKEMAVEKRKRIEEQKIMLELELENALTGHKKVGFKRAYIFYKKGKFNAKVHFSRKEGYIGKIPKLWITAVPSTPEGILEEFKKDISTI